MNEMDELPQQQKLSFVAGFIEKEAPAFHPAFAGPSKLSPSTMKYEDPDTLDLRQTLERHQKRASKYVDFTDDLNKCTWKDVHEQLAKAQEAMERSEARVKNPAIRAKRFIGSTSSILAPGLSAIPDDLCILHGALAVVFSVRWHSFPSQDPFA